MPTLSCYMIVRDAEETLELALNSIARRVDELVVVDTGSTDQTRELARRFTDTVYSYPWRDHFGDARQYALAQCTGDWTVFLDADDELVGAETLRPLVEQAPDHIGMYLLRYITGRTPDGEVTQEFWRERVVRRELCHWVGRVHEVLLPVTATHYARHEGAYVEHRRTGGGLQSLQRNIRLLELSLAEAPDDTRTMFYLGRDLIQVGQVDRGVDLLERYIPLGTWTDEQHIAAQLIAGCHRAAGRFSDALGTDAAGILLHPEWPHTWFALAQDCYFLQRWAASVQFCEIGQLCAAPDTSLFLSPAALEYDWMLYQACALFHVGRVADALAQTEAALALRPDDPQHLYNRHYFQSQLAPARALVAAP